MSAAEAMDPVAVFQGYRGLLFGIAYRMVGSVGDAEDLVQEAFVRWQEHGGAEVRSPKAYLVAVISRLCVKHQQAARRSRADYIGPWLPEPLLVDEDADPSAAAEMKESLSMAFMVLLERLGPAERAAFLLHDVFGYGYDEVAAILDKSEAACRQIAHRARQHVTANRPRFDPSPQQQERLLGQFLAASSSGDLRGLLAL